MPMQSLSAPAPPLPNTFGPDPTDFSPSTSVAWTFDPVVAAGSKTMLTGLLYATGIHVYTTMMPGPDGITRISTFCDVAGSGLSNCGFALYGGVGTGGNTGCALIQQAIDAVGLTQDFSASLGAGSSGSEVVGNLPNAMTILPGFYYICLWQNGTPASTYRGGNANADLGNWPNYSSWGSGGSSGTQRSNFRAWSESGHAALAAAPTIGTLISAANIEQPWWAAIEQL